MCLIGIVWRAHPKFELVLAANRDEFHHRPSAGAAAWKDHPQIFGGRDLQQQGSWLAVSKDGRLAAVTNVRRMATPDPRAPSRGRLVAQFLQGSDSAADYAARLKESADSYAGFNLLLYDGHDLRYVDNHPEFEDVAVAPGVHVLSNAQLDTPWPKSKRLRLALETWAGDKWESPAPLLKALADRAPAAEDELPDTGVGPALERLLSPPFIVSPNYGTRCSTVVTFGNGTIEFVEKRFDAAGRAAGESHQTIPVIPAPAARTKQE